MTVTVEELDRFHDFAVSHVSGAPAGVTWLELFNLWRLENPSAAEYAENVAAIQEALNAMDAGRFRPFSDFDAEFRERHGMSSKA